MNDKRYIVIIGDIHASRELKNREMSQKQLLTVLDEINTKYKRDILSPFSISMGDSFQGLLKLDASILNILMDLEFAMQPIVFRFGIGIGEITTSINTENSQLNDGPAYHYARSALEVMEDQETKYETRKTNTMLYTAAEETGTDRLINAIFALTTAIKSKWSERQKEIIQTYLAHNENQYETAHALDIDQSNISKTLKTTNFYAYKSSLEDIQEFMLDEAKEESNA